MQHDIPALRTRLAKLLFANSYTEGDFTLSSGKKASYYFDCRQTALHAEGSWLIGMLFNDLLRDVPVLGVGGLTLGADPLVSATTVISHNSGKPLHGLLVRKAAKGHGTGQFVEGLHNFPAQSSVAVLEDVVTSGGSVLQACQRITDAGLKVALVCAILDREEGGQEAITQAGYAFMSLFTRASLLELAKA